MKNIRIVITDREYWALKRFKGKSTWRQFLLRAIRIMNYDFDNFKKCGKKEVK